MSLKYLSMMFLLFVGTTVSAGYLETNSTFPLGESSISDANLTLLGGIAQSVRTEGSLVTNPATIASDRFISFKFNFAGIKERVSIEDSKVDELRILNNQISMVLPAGMVGNFFTQYYISYENRFYVQDPVNFQEVDLNGSVSTAVFGWGRNFYGYNVGVSLSKNFGSFYSRTIHAGDGSTTWEPFLSTDVNVDYSDKTVDNATFGLKKKFGKFDIGASYSLGDNLKLTKEYRQGSLAPYAKDASQIIKDTKADTSSSEINLGKRLAGGVSYNSNTSGFNLDFNLQPDGIKEFFEIGLGIKKNFRKDRNLPLRIGINGKRIDIFEEYYEGVGAIGTEYFMEKQRGKIDFSIGGIHRQGDNNITENALFISVGITGFSTWGGVEIK